MFFKEESMEPEGHSSLFLVKKKEELTPLQAIKAKCMDCSNNQPSEIRFCTVKICPLWPLRFGKNPKRAGIGGKGRRFVKTEEEAKSADHQISKLIKRGRLTSLQRQCYSHVRRG